MTPEDLRTGSPPGRAGGFLDLLPGDASRRQRMVGELLADFAAWGYEQLHTPLAEPLETIITGLGGGGQDHLFRFMDSDGSLLALVGERTVSVARVVATQLRERDLPLRLCYAGPVLLNQPLHGGRRREVLQAGCELVGSPELTADAECIALAVEALHGVGLSGIQVDVGHSRFLPGLLRDAGLDAPRQQRVLDALAGRDLVAVGEALDGTAIGEVERSLLLRFPALRGGVELLDAAAEGLNAPHARAALADLALLWDMLEAHGVAGCASIDLGAVRDWGYYSGPIFELFSTDVGFPLGAGGRYDHLLARFGHNLPATGFVVYVDRCCDALTRAAGAPSPAACIGIGHAQGAAADAYEAGRRLRAAGLRASCSPGFTDSAQECDLYIDAQALAHWRDDAGVRRGGLDEAVAALLVAALGAEASLRR